MSEWRVIPSYPAYEASSDGQIRTRATGHIKRQRPEKNGYLKVGLWVYGRDIRRWAHRLICEAFHGPMPAPKMHAAHGNGVPSDNDASNLSWKTKTENEHDKRAHGTANIGQRNGMAQLTDAAVTEIKACINRLPRSSGGKRIKKGALVGLARLYGVSAGCLRQIVSGKNWSHI